MWLVKAVGMWLVHVVGMWSVKAVGSGRYVVSTVYVVSVWLVQ